MRDIAKEFDRLLRKGERDSSRLSLVQSVLSLKDPENYTVVRKPPSAQKNIKRGALFGSPCGYFKSTDRKRVIAHQANCKACQAILGKPAEGMWKCERCGETQSEHDIPQTDALLHKVCSTCYNTPTRVVGAT